MTASMYSGRMNTQMGGELYRLAGGLTSKKLVLADLLGVSKTGGSGRVHFNFYFFC